MWSLQLLAVASVVISLASCDYVIDPNSVPIGTRTNWCFNQEQTCPILCLQIPPGTTVVNNCNATLLTYGCLCGNGVQPNVTEYTLTLPFFVCQEWQIQCQTKCSNYDNTCIAACTQQHPCGAQNPSRANATATTSTVSASTSLATATASASPTSPIVYTGPDSQPQSATSISAAVSVVRLFGPLGFITALAGITFLLV